MKKTGIINPLLFVSPSMVTTTASRSTPPFYFSRWLRLIPLRMQHFLARW